jgi:hypothetical protein
MGAGFHTVVAAADGIGLPSTLPPDDFGFWLSESRVTPKATWQFVLSLRQ